MIGLRINIGILEIGNKMAKVVIKIIYSLNGLIEDHVSVFILIVSNFRTSKLLKAYLSQLYLRHSSVIA